MTPTPPMTTADLDRWDRLCQAASPGPWAVDGGSNQYTSVRRSHALAGERYRIASIGIGRYADPQDKADAAFIAEARTAIPALLARVRDLEAALARIRGAGQP